MAQKERVEMMATTIQCEECDFCTDIELTSDTNPSRCPECGGRLMIANTVEPLYGEDGEINAILCEGTTGRGYFSDIEEGS